MTPKHWKEEYEDAAGAELETLSALPLAELMHRVERQQFGDYHVIWDAIAGKRNLSVVGWRLFEFVQGPAEYLHRYHCARGLLLLLETTTYQPADLTVRHRNPEKWLAEIEQLLVQRIGPRPRTAG